MTSENLFNIWALSFLTHMVQFENMLELESQVEFQL